MDAKNQMGLKRELLRQYTFFLILTSLCSAQTMTEAEHNRPIPKLFYNRPSASATEVFCETIGLVIYVQNIPIIVSFSLLLS